MVFAPPSLERALLSQGRQAMRCIWGALPAQGQGPPAAQALILGKEKGRSDGPSEASSHPKRRGACFFLEVENLACFPAGSVVLRSTRACVCVRVQSARPFDLAAPPLFLQPHRPSSALLLPILGKIQQVHEA